MSRQRPVRTDWKKPRTCVPMLVRPATIRIEIMLAMIAYSIEVVPERSPKKRLRADRAASE
jgi:hypothetical protein